MNMSELAGALGALEDGGPVLADKLDAARAFMRKALEVAGPDVISVAWTGGKDSTLALWLWRSVLAEAMPAARPRAISLDTGYKFPEIIAFRDALAREWDIDLHIARPAVDLDSYPVALDKVTCCRDLKVLPLAAALRETDTRILLTGIRADEHVSRKERPAVEVHDDPPHLRLAPILHCAEMDVWSAIMDYDLPRCVLYDRGYRSLGCMPCTVLPGEGGDERSGRDQDKEGQLSTLHSLGYF